MNNKKPSYEDLEKRIHDLEKQIEKMDFQFKIISDTIELEKDIQVELNKVLIEQHIILENVCVGISKIINRKQVWVNKKTAEMFQYSKEELEGDTTRKLYPSDEAYELLGKTAYPILASGNTYECIQELIRKDGKSILVRYNGKAIDPGDMSKGTIWILEDITEQKNKENLLKESEEKYRRLIEGSPNIVYTYSNKRGGLYYSKRAELILGYSLSYLHENPFTWYESIHPEDKNIVDSVFKKTNTHENFEIEYRIKDSKGNWLWFYDRSVGITSTNDEIIIESIAVNITERKHAEEKLKREKDFTSRIMETSVVGILYVNKYGYITIANPIAANILNFSIDEITKMQYNFPNLKITDIDGNPIPEENMPFIKVKNSMKPVIDLQHSIELPDGKRILLSVNAAPMINSNGEFEGMVASIENITARKKTELELQSKTEALTHSNTDLEQFAYSVSHDMRQPLRTITGHLQLLERGLKNKLEGDDKENLKFALDGAKRMNSMIISLLEYSRVGRKTESKTWIESKEPLVEALNFLALAIKESRAIINISGKWPMIFASRDEIIRLFQNLINNAIYYCEKDKTPEVEIFSQAIENIWKVKIQDRGIGIDPGQMNRLFQFFSRLQSRERFEGTGMGLALCRRIVEHHGGNIYLKSEGIGKGSEFIFEIPIKSEENE